MKSSTSRAFYLAVFALFSDHCLVSAAAATPSQASPDVCAFEPKAKVSDACASYADLDQLNTRLYPYVRSLANNTDFFSYYRLNLYDKQCPFWSDENGLCGNIACAVTTIENEGDIPDIWKAEELSRLEGPKAKHPPRKEQRELQRPLQGELGDGVGESCVVEYDDECDERDYCVPEDEGAGTKGDYVSLNDNPERFTGYSGEGAHQVWDAIYRENCFSKPGAVKSQSAGSLSSDPFSPFGQNQAQAAMDFKQVMKAHDRQQAQSAGAAEDGPDFEDECLEKRVFHRVISGMHTSISTHLCYDYLNQTTGEWGPNLQCYKDRLHRKPERISNLYFNYAFLLRAVGKLRDYVQDYTFCTGDTVQDARTKKMITVLADAIPAGPKIFDESVMFTDHTLTGVELKEDFRNRFRNVSRIMDCVGCDKCRLWGKLQTNGFGTALKVLFEFGHGDVGQEKPLLRRTELVALINTLDKTSSALKALEYFRAAVEAETTGIEAPASSAAPVSSPSESSSALPDLDDLDDFETSEDRRQQDEEETVMSVLKQELSTVYLAMIFVLKSWVTLPKRLAEIAFIEVWRLLAFWLGQPVPERVFDLQFPTEKDLFPERREL
ncbi:endoplasmic oxidoreductin-1 [Oleoguttula sp. CCFEE 5521]